MATMTRQQEISKLWQQYQGLYVMAGMLIGLLLFPFLELIINDLSQLLIGLVPESMGIGFTVFFLDRIYQRREEKRKAEDLKERLRRDAGSNVRDVAVKAVEELEAHEWLKGDNGLLKGANLKNANLSEASLGFANLSRVSLGSANLDGADLGGVNLEGASLLEANMKGAFLVGVNLSGAFLGRANLSEANLWDANLSGAFLWRANLSGAILGGANLFGANLRATNLENVVWEISVGGEIPSVTLPDGTEWTSDTDMSSFTDPKHPEYNSILEKIDAILDEMGLISIDPSGWF